MDSLNFESMPKGGVPTIHPDVLSSLRMQAEQWKQHALQC